MADDLTGALDAAAPFAARGLETVVALGAGAIGRALESRPKVIAVSTASREIPADAAFAAVKSALSGLPATRWVFKKVDSRLKGHIEAELAAFPPGKALIAPAIPDFGRIVQDGRITGFGVEAPIDIATRIGLRSEEAIIPDTVTPDQMRRALQDWEGGLLIGARGLAEALAQEMTQTPVGLIDSLPGPEALFVIGSRDPITAAQVQYLHDMGGCHLLHAPGGEVEEEWPGQGPLLLQAVTGAQDLSGETVAARLAKAVADQLPRYRSILLTGGATAEAVLDRAGIDVLYVRGECLPGLAVAEAGGRIFVTKSGGFGQSDTLRRVFAMLENGGKR